MDAFGCGLATVCGIIIVGTIGYLLWSVEND